jgi:glycine hydroxymethyltransferase
MKRPEMTLIAEWIDRILRRPGDEALARQVRGEVKELCDRFPLYGPWMEDDTTRPLGLGPRELAGSRGS